MEQSYSRYRDVPQSLLAADGCLLRLMHGRSNPVFRLNNSGKIRCGSRSSVAGDADGVQMATCWPQPELDENLEGLLNTKFPGYSSSITNHYIFIPNIAAGRQDMSAGSSRVHHQGYPHGQLTAGVITSNGQQLSKNVFCHKSSQPHAWHSAVRTPTGA
jgi:hypothetical protein